MGERYLKDGRLEVRRWCLCGMSFRASGDEKSVRGVEALMESQHEGEGHGDCGPRQAARARARQYNEASGVS